MAITLTPTVASPTAKVSAVGVDVAGASSNDIAAYNASSYPSEAEIRCYIAFIKGGVELGRSYVFSVSADGKHRFNNYIFPSSGSWTMSLRKASDNTVLATQAITVS
jgi:hypothetical protein